MRAGDLVKWAWKGLKERRLRTSLTVLGIVIGAAAIIALVSQTSGMQESINAQLTKLGPNTIFIMPSSMQTRLTLIDVERMKQIPGVQEVIPAYYSRVTLYGSGGSESLSLFGIRPDHIEPLFGEIKIEKGRLMLASSAPEAVVGYEIVHPPEGGKALADVGQAITLEFMVGKKTFRKTFYVVGSLEEYGASPFIRVDRIVFISLESAKQTFNRDYFDVIFIKADTPEDVDKVVDYLKIFYGAELDIITVKQIAQIVSRITSTIGFFFGTIAAISLFVAGLGIMNIMFVSVMERTREIGVLKALGFKDSDVMKLFLWEAMLVGIIGGVIGIVAGIGGSYILPFFFSKPIKGVKGTLMIQYTPIFSLDLLVLVLLFSVAVSVLAGLLPARRAAKLDPVVALRHE